MFIFWGLVKAKGQLPDIRSYSDPATFTGTVLLYTTGNLLIRGAVYENGMIVGDLKPKEGAIGTVGMGANLLKSYVEVGEEEDVHCGKPECDPVTVTGHRPTPPPPFPLPPLPPVSPPSFPPAPPLPTGGGGGGYTPPVQRDPCAEAKAGAANATTLSANPVFSVSKRAIQNKAEDGKEHGISFGRDANGKIITSSVTTGAEHRGTVGTVTNRFADLHNHPNNDPPSSGDIYGFIDLVSANSNYQTRYVVTLDGSVYALVVTDLAAARKFNKSHPRQAPVGGNEPAFPPALVSEYIDVEYYSRGSKEIATAFILSKYNTGVALLKQDADRNFKRLNTKQSTGTGGNKVYTADNCK